MKYRISKRLNSSLKFPSILTEISLKMKYIPASLFRFFNKYALETQFPAKGWYSSSFGFIVDKFPPLFRWWEGFFTEVSCEPSSEHNLAKTIKYEISIFLVNIDKVIWWASNWFIKMTSIIITLGLHLIGGLALGLLCACPCWKTHMLWLVLDVDKFAAYNSNWSCVRLRRDE